MADRQRFLAQLKRLYDARPLVFNEPQAREYWGRIGRNDADGEPLFTDADIVAAVDRALDEVAPDFGIVPLAVLLRLCWEARKRHRPTATPYTEPPRPSPDQLEAFRRQWRALLSPILAQVGSGEKPRAGDSFRSRRGSTLPPPSEEEG